MIHAFVRYLKKQSYNPGFLGLFINPFYIARRGLYKAISKYSVELNGSVLDVGCGWQPYRHLFKTNTYLGLELESDSARMRNIADVYYDGEKFPFNSATFESILCNQVLEHVFNPDSFLKEMHRVLVPGGKLLLTVPFLWDEHEQPFDFARYSSFGLAYLLENHGFKILYQEKITTNISTLFQLVNAYLFKITLHWPTYLSIIFTALIISWITIFGIIMGLILPDNDDLYLDQIVIAEKI